METNQFHNTKSINTHQLKRRHFKIENMFQTLLDWNLLQNALKSNFEKMKRSEIKTLVTNHLLDKYTK